MSAEELNMDIAKWCCESYAVISPDVSIFPSTAEGYEQFVDMCFEVLENTDGDGALAFKILTELVKEMKTTS